MKDKGGTMKPDTGGYGPELPTAKPGPGSGGYHGFIIDDEPYKRPLAYRRKIGHVERYSDSADHCPQCTICRGAPCPTNIHGPVKPYAKPIGV
jgi:hypothetical protein